MIMRNKPPAWGGCVTLAIFATGISISLSVLTGWQLGDSVLTKIMMAAAGVLAVMGAHLMPAICASAAPGARVVGLSLWLFCLLYAAFSHANFFLSSQQRAGVQREISIMANPVVGKPQKELIEVLNDRIKVQTELAKIQLLCRDVCVKWAPAKANLEARIALLNAQESEARSWQKKLDQRQIRQDVAREDIVLVRFAGWFNVTVAQLELLMGMIFSLILEGVACLCWYLVLRPRDVTLSQSVTTTVIAPVTLNASVTNTSQTSQTPSLPEYDDQVDQLVKLVKAGIIKLTVASIRKYCCCAQGKASDLKRQVQAIMDAECHA